MKIFNHKARKTQRNFVIKQSGHELLPWPLDNANKKAMGHAHGHHKIALSNDQTMGVLYELK
jgi:hypothetical protein